MPTDINSIQAWVAVAQLIITVVTIVLLLSTFRLQAETYKKQAEATNAQFETLKLEMEKDRRSIKPFFKVRHNYFSVGDYSSYGFEVFLERNSAFGVLLTVPEVRDLFLESSIQNVSEWSISDSRGFQFTSVPEIEGPIDICFILFQDEDGRLYSQKVTYHARDRYEITVPILK